MQSLPVDNSKHVEGIEGSGCEAPPQTSASAETVRGNPPSAVPLEIASVKVGEVPAATAETDTSTDVKGKGNAQVKVPADKETPAAPLTEEGEIPLPPQESSTAKAIVEVDTTGPTVLIPRREMQGGEEADDEEDSDEDLLPTNKDNATVSSRKTVKSLTKGINQVETLEGPAKKETLAQLHASLCTARRAMNLQMKKIADKKAAREKETGTIDKPIDIHDPKPNVLNLSGQKRKAPSMDGKSTITAKHEQARLKARPRYEVKASRAADDLSVIEVNQGDKGHNLLDIERIMASGAVRQSFCSVTMDLAPFSSDNLKAVHEQENATREIPGPQPTIVLVTRLVAVNELLSSSDCSLSLSPRSLPLCLCTVVHG
jgi:hypothetical protein